MLIFFFKLLICHHVKKENKKTKTIIILFPKEKEKKTRKRKRNKHKNIWHHRHDVIYKITSPWQSHGLSVCLPLLVFLYNYFIDWNQFWCNPQPETPPPLSSPKKDIWVLTVRWWKERVHAKQAKVQHNLWALEGGCLNQRKEEEASRVSDD